MNKAMIHESCPKCKKDTLHIMEDKYALVSDCRNCGYFMPKYFECCNDPLIEKVIYYQKDDRKTVREQCANCGKRLNRPAIAFSHVKEENLKHFDEALSETRSNEVSEIKTTYNLLISSNRERVFNAYYFTDEWKELRQRVFQRDKYKCTKCGAIAEQAHHLTYARFRNERLEDLVSVCVKCHALIHNYKESKTS